jgi:hypothetical protein
VLARLQADAARPRRATDLDGCGFCGRPSAARLCEVCEARRVRLAARFPRPVRGPALWVPEVVVGAPPEGER